jgi:Rrf2 family protein
VRLSDGIEWALHCAVVLSTLPEDASLPAARLAEFHGVPPAYLAKHLQALTREGILTAGTGRRGGYRLARPAEDITVLDVVLAIEGDEEAFRCNEIRRRGPSASPRTAYPLPCTIHRTMQAAEAAYRAALGATTIASLRDQTMSVIDPRVAANSLIWFQEVLS